MGDFDLRFRGVRLKLKETDNEQYEWLKKS